MRGKGTTLAIGHQCYSAYIDIESATLLTKDIQ